MTNRAWAYIATILTLGATITALALTTAEQSSADLYTFLALTVFATAAQLFEAEAPNRQSYYPTRVFQFAGVILLHPFFLVLLMAIPHLIEWAKARMTNSPRLRAWYVQPFNISTHIVAGITARGVYILLAGGGTVALSPLSVLAILASALTYASVNHALVGLALVLARGVSWRDSGILDGENILTDLVLLLMGYVVAVLWTINPWLALPALAPLILIYRALKIPQLEKDAQTDEKTGLWNARHFATLFTTEMERASRFNRPVAIIMADLDLLRNINNTYGHLAGDVVLSGIGQIIRKTIREYDVAGRFGGEEFAIVLPEASPAEAQSIAERLRQAVESAAFTVATSTVPIHATMSLGVSCYPLDALLPNDLIHEADVAVYQAKLRGRNCVVMASEVPHSIKLESGVPLDRLSSPYAAAFAPRPGSAAGVGDPDVVAHTPSLPVKPDEAPAAVAQQQGEPSSSPIESPPPPRAASSKSYPKFVLPLFVGGVISMAALASVLGFWFTPQPDLLAIGLLALIAVFAEALQVDVYGANTVAVTTSVGFAAALIGGIPGVVIVSTANALGHRLRFESRSKQPFFDRKTLHKTAFNWGNHVLAGTATVLAMARVSDSMLTSHLLDLSHVPTLAIFALIASLAYYGIETGLITIALGLEKGMSFITIWREQFRWLAGHYVVMCVLGLFLSIAYTSLGLLGVGVFLMPVLMMRYSQKQYVDRTEGNMRELRRLNLELTHANREIMGASQAIRQLNDELFLTLGKIIDARDPYVSGHADKVADYATAIAKDLGLPPARVEQVRQAAFLHDIGKIAISEHVLHKPSSLTKEEYAYIKTHATLGAGFLETSQGLRRLAPFVKHHHEWWDGTGYPDKLRGEEIPLEARILSVCDAVEAMASDRPYHRALSLSEIINEIRRCAGSQFDPSVVETFVHIAEREGAHLVVNSAREVLRRQADKSERVSFGNEWVAFQENVGNALSTV